MKTFLFYFVLLSSLTFTHAQITNLAAGVMHFDSTTEESLSGLIPTYPGGNAFTYVDDRLGNPHAAIQLSSTLNYGNPAFSQMGLSDFTIAFWFRKDGSLWSDRPIIKKAFFSFSDPNNFISEHYAIQYNNWIGSGFMHYSFQPVTDSSAATGSIGHFPDSVWAHLAFSYHRNDSINVYVNGAPYTSIFIGNLSTYPANIDSASLEIGWGNMSLDEIYFFKSALTSSEVAELYRTLPAMASLSEQNLDDYMKVFPNPNKGEFTLEISNGKVEYQNLRITDLLGKEISYTAKQTGNNNIQIFFSDNAKGVHLLHVQTKNGTKIKKILIQ